MEKESSSNSSPKTFNLNFAPMGCSQKRERLTLFVSGEYPIGAKFGLKVFGKWSGEEPFLRLTPPVLCQFMNTVTAKRRLSGYALTILYNF